MNPPAPADRTGPGLPDEPGSVETSAPPMSDGVRTRVVALTAEAMGAMSAEHLPGSLKRVAAFAPVRRAKVAGTQIARALEDDDDFRAHVATQVRALAGELAAALETGQPPPDADPVEVGALAYLLRTPHWHDVVEQAARPSEADRPTESDRKGEELVDGLQRRLEEAQTELGSARARQRRQTEELRGENALLRRRLGEARKRVREVEDASESAARRAADELSSASATVAGGEAESRRLRARVADLERELASVRRNERTGRATETMRARLLLDTVLESARGLQRELALPASSGTPADAVAADPAVSRGRASSGLGSLSPDDPALLEELLNLPRAHLVVDGYNVTKSGYPDLSLERQRERLLGGLGPLAARHRAEITVVFDAAETRDRPVVGAPRGVRVSFSPYEVIADDVIRQYVDAEPAGRPVVVVTSDRALAADVLAAGFTVVTAAALTQLLARSRR